MKLQKRFLQGKINKDLDERLLPDGEYPHAENIRVSNTHGSDVGSAEVVKGNKQVTFLSYLINPFTLGAFSDAANHKIYWFNTSDNFDQVLEYDTVNNNLSILLESSKPNGILNFNKNHLITGVVKIINGDHDKDLIAWTDDLNDPRLINIERCKTYGRDGFEEEDINLIKKPPRYSPDIRFTYAASGSNDLEDRFFSFAYRYKYQDGEYSALSSFTDYGFAPAKFSMDYQTMENNGMINSYNAIEISFDTGDKRVIEIELVYKESNSNTIYRVEKFNKSDMLWSNDVIKKYTFSNNKKYRALPQDEIYRSFDNVPRRAKALDIIGNRLVFGNYVEGYNMVDELGQSVFPNYDVSVINKNLSGESLKLEYSSDRRKMFINIDNGLLTKDSRLIFEPNLKGVIYNHSEYDGKYESELSFILNKNYSNVEELVIDEEFIAFIEEVLQNNFIANYNASPASNFNLKYTIGFKLEGVNNGRIVISAPTIVYDMRINPSDPNDTTVEEKIANWTYNNASSVYYRSQSVDTTVKSNRSYEIGIIYLDPYGRRTPTLTDLNNTVFVHHKYSDFQNKIMVNINSKPPYWADRYKLVVKQNKNIYYTVYTSIFYEDGIYRWVKLEGANKNKVKEGDTLIVKSDLDGIMREPIEVRVLEVSQKERNFIDDNYTNDSEIIEENGLYMKIKPSGFNMEAQSYTQLHYDKYSARKKGTAVVEMCEDKLYYTSDRVILGRQVGGRNGTLAGYLDDSTKRFVDYEIPAGTHIYMKFHNYESDGFSIIYEKGHIVQENHDNFQQWFEREVVDLGEFKDDFLISFHRRNYDDAENLYGNALYMRIETKQKGTQFERTKLSCQIQIQLVEGMVIFETKPEDSIEDIYYETSETYDIIEGYHQGNVQNQNYINPSIVEMNFHNAYIQGGGVESYRYKDAFNSKYLNIDLRPSTTSVEDYSEIRRYSDLTYGEPYNENSNINGLNEFNLGRGNFKEDLEKKYGYIQKIMARDTDLVVFQEDKISKVLYGKDVLMNADGTSNVSKLQDILGQQVTYKGEYGISTNPESLISNGYNVYFTDSKRGAVMRLGTEGLYKISNFGLKQYFKDVFRSSVNNVKIGGYDPYYDEYVLHMSTHSNYPDEYITCSGKVLKSNFNGEIIINIDYGLSIGTAGFNYQTNGVPIKIELIYEDIVFSTGFVGDKKYDSDLAELGLPSVVSGSIGTVNFDKVNIAPTTAKLKITAPLCDSSFTITGSCIFSQEKEVITIVRNTKDYINKSSVNRYKWVKNGYTSPVKSYRNTYENEGITMYDVIVGKQGDNYIPVNGSTIIMEAYSSVDQGNVFASGGKFKYLLSNNYYNESDILNVLSTFNSITPNYNEYPNGDKLFSSSFDLPEIFDEKYIYLLYDYSEGPQAIDDYVSVERGKTKVFNLFENDISYDNGVLEIIDIPTNGTAVVNADNTVTYTHNGGDSTVDKFTYRFNKPYISSNVASVYVDIALGCDEAFTMSGGGVYTEIDVSFGTRTGECGINYDAYTVKDKFEIEYNGVIVASTNDTVAGKGVLTFNKTTKLPTTAKIIVSSPDSGTAWYLNLICPNN